MKKISLGIGAMLISVIVGIFLTKTAKAYFLFSDLQNQIRVTWQDEESSCSKPEIPIIGDKAIVIHKPLNGDENSVIYNPLCGYSVDLSEIPSVSFSELNQNPKFYDRKIIRVQGRFFSEGEDDFVSRFYMKKEDGFAEQHIGVGYWNEDVRAKLCKFIDVNAPDTNNADVTLNIQFSLIEDQATKDFNSGSPFYMSIYYIEKMIGVRSVDKTQPKRPRIHISEKCRRDTQLSLSN